jgi:RNA polymerase sigma-70 factor, ECF subfamily
MYADAVCEPLEGIANKGQSQLACNAGVRRGTNCRYGRSPRLVAALGNALLFPIVYNPITIELLLQTEEPSVQAAENDVTLLLNAWCGGDASALDRVIPLVYEELRGIAHRQMSRERAGHTLQSNALVNEVYLRLIRAKEVHWHNRAHFFFSAAKLMRRILVDHARARCRLKRGGRVQKLEFDPSMKIPSTADANVAKIDDALGALEEVDSRKAKVVELRFFGGFSVAETAEALGVSERTVMSDWKFAKVWLLRELENRGGIA